MTSLAYWCEPRFSLRLQNLHNTSKGVAMRQLNNLFWKRSYRKLFFWKHFCRKTVPGNVFGERSCRWNCAQHKSSYIWVKPFQRNSLCFHPQTFFIFFIQKLYFFFLSNRNFYQFINFFNAVFAFVFFMSKISDLLLRIFHEIFTIFILFVFNFLHADMQSWGLNSVFVCSFVYEFHSVSFFFWTNNLKLSNQTKV